MKVMNQISNLNSLVKIVSLMQNNGQNFCLRKERPQVVVSNREFSWSQLISH